MLILWFGEGGIGGLFLIGLASDLAMFTVVTSGKYPPVWGDHADSLRNVILGAYGIPLGAVCGGLISIKKRITSLPGTSAIFFIGLVLVWNFLAVAPVAQLAFDSSVKVGECQSALQSLIEKGSFLITGALAYFFGTKADG